jgi:RNA polymerase sigma-70 factor (ECF subfamily)
VKEAIVGPSERYLVWRLRRGDRDACRDLVRRYHGRVYGYLRRLGADPPLAEDLTQETYARAWNRIETLRKATSLRSWLLTIARNQYLQWVRVKRVDTAAIDGLPETADRAPTVESDLALREAVDRLEPDLQETVALHYFQGLTLREIGAVLEAPVGTVKSRLHRALVSLRALLERQEADHEQQRPGKAFAGPS